jgi:xanthine dehydrogenase molybdenum-binding subunit
MADYKLIGKNYVTPDLVAKVTGKARYAEDYRAEGMLFVKLLLSPRPHARVTRIDASAALAMPGVHGVLTADDMPAPPPPPAPPAAPPAPAATAAAAAPAAAQPPAPPRPNVPAEVALTKEPVYEGEPILAVAADSEEIAAAAIERIVVDYEPLPFVIDPLDSLKPGGPDGRVGGNVFVGANLQSLKWTAADIAQVEAGKFPATAEASETLAFGDVEKGFAEADLVIERDHYQQTTSHQPLETRTAMAYWQNGKCYLHGSTQSVARTVASAAGWIGIKPEELVLISEYTGGGFGSKIPGAHSMAIPALMSKKLNGRPVMMRISREEETYIGRTRPGYQGWIKMGFKKDGRMTACDVFVVEAAGPYRRQGDHATSANNASLMYQVPNMRFRGVSVATNTPPATSQRAPGGLQASVMFEPMIDEAARKLGLDRIAIRKTNAPEGQAQFGLVPANAPPGRPRNKLTSCFLKECLDKGAEMFNWEERKQRSGQRRGNKITGVAVASGSYTAGSIGVDGLCVLKPDGKLYIHQGIGNLGTHSVSDTARVIAEQVDMPWEKCVVVWGNTGNHLAWSSVQAGSQTTYAHTRANYAAGQALKRNLQELAAAELGGSPDDYDVGNERVFRKGNPGRAIPFAKAAELAIKRGGKFDGHEVPKELNGMTKASAAGLAGLGLMGVARDNLPRDGQTYSFQAAFIEIEVDAETGAYRIVDYLAVADVGTVMHPNSLGGQIHGGAVQGFGHVRSQTLAYDPHYGAALANRLYNNKPPTILDIPVEVPCGGRPSSCPTRPTRLARRASASRPSAPAAAPSSARSQTPWVMGSCAEPRCTPSRFSCRWPPASRRMKR